MKKHRARRPAQPAPTTTPDPSTRPMGLPQDSVRRAHLRRQADWAKDGPRLCRRSDATMRKRRLIAEIDRTGAQNREENREQNREENRARNSAQNQAGERG